MHTQTLNTLNPWNHNTRILILRVIHTTLALALIFVAGASLAAESGVVNINTAGASELANLPRVGPALSERIVEFREENGKFKDPADLMLVRGIGEKTFQLMEAYVTTQGETTLDTKVRTSDAEARLADKGAKAEDPKD